jgi:hypothetical protein
MKIMAIIIAANLGTCFFGSNASTAEIKLIAGPPDVTAAKELVKFLTFAESIQILKKHGMNPL